MLIECRFDFESRFVAIPDGFVRDINELTETFFDWAYDQPEYLFLSKDQKRAYHAFDENALIAFLNRVVLCDCNEKAYAVSRIPNMNASIPVIRF